MRFTVRFAHLKELPDYLVGQSIIEGDQIGTMGSTGQSQFSHVHMDVVEGFINRVVRLVDIGYEGEKVYTPNIKQLNHFIEEPFLFKIEPNITTYFYEPEYKLMFGKDHPGYDLVPKDRHKSKEHYDLFWNRSAEGKVLAVGYDQDGYGNYILIGFES